jgi:hypothetical protein
MGRTTAAIAFVLSCLLSAGVLLIGPRLLAPPLELAEPGGEVVPREGAAPLAVATENAPRLVIERTSIDLGEVVRGEPARFVFDFRNDGEGPLVIHANPSCGCTLVRYEKLIPAGSQSQLEAELNTARLEGPVTKSIDVQTNDPRRRRLYLDLIVNVITPPSAP